MSETNYQFVYQSYDKNNAVDEGCAFPTLKEAMEYALQKEEWIKFSIHKEQVVHE